MTSADARRRSAPPDRAGGSAPNPPAAKTTEYEFGGPLGAASIMFGLPAVIFGTYFACTKEFCIVDGASVVGGSSGRCAAEGEQPAYM